MPTNCTEQSGLALTRTDRACVRACLPGYSWGPPKGGTTWWCKVVECPSRERGRFAASVLYFLRSGFRKTKRLLGRKRGPGVPCSARRRCRICRSVPLHCSLLLTVGQNQSARSRRLVSCLTPLRRSVASSLLLRSRDVDGVEHPVAQHDAARARGGTGRSPGRALSTSQKVLSQNGYGHLGVTLSEVADVADLAT